MNTIVSSRIISACAAFIALVGLWSSAKAALSPEEVFGVKWGATQEEVTAAMSARNLPVIPKYTSDTRLVFSGGTVAGLEAQNWNFCFVQGRLYRAYILFKERPGNPEGTFNDVKKVITEKYGERQRETYKPEEPMAVWNPLDASGRQTISITLLRHTKTDDKRLRLEYKNLLLEKLVPGQSDPKNEGL